jgi:hypothetical protein
MSGESVRTKTQRLRSSEERWDKGTEAEEATATALIALPPSWAVLADLTWPGRRFENIDHVVIGPAGVFVIDTKSWSGRVSIEKGALLQSGQDRSPAVWAASAAARSLSGLVPSVRADHVHAVICVGEGDTRVAWIDGVLICSPSQLVDEMTRHTEVLPGGLVRAVSAEVDRRLRPVEPPPAAPGGAEQQPGAKATGRKRRPFAALVLAVLATAAAVFLVSQPDALTSFVDGVERWADVAVR